MSGALWGGLAGFVASKTTDVMPPAYGNRIEVPSESDGLPTEHGIQEMIDLLDAQAQADLEKLKELFGC